MDILDYLDAATRHVASSQEAKDVRDELYDHYLRAVEAHLAAGRSFDEARTLALEALGPADLIQSVGSRQRPMRDTLAILCLAGGWLSAVLSFVYPAVFPVPLGLSVAAVLLQPPKRLGAILRRHPLLIAVGIVDGLVVGTYPLWSAGPYSYWAGVATSPVTLGVIVILMLGTPLYLIWRMARHPGAEFVAAGLSSAIFALSAFLATALFWRLYPISPSPNVDWYTTPSLAGLTTEGTHLLWFMLLWYLGSFAVAAIVREVRLRRFLATAPIATE